MNSSFETLDAWTGMAGGLAALQWNQDITDDWQQVGERLMLWCMIVLASDTIHLLDPDHSRFYYHVSTQDSNDQERKPSHRQVPHITCR